MTEIAFARGEVLFKEGESGDFVCLMLSGEAEVIKELGAQRVILGQIKAGEFVGEMGVLEGQPRSATVRAVSDGTLELIGRNEFLRRVSEDGVMALTLLTRLSERLRKAGDRVAAAAVSLADHIPDAPEYAPEEVAVATTPHILRLFAAGTGVTGALPEDGLVVTEFPFVVGRVSDGPAAVARVHLPLDDARPYRLSRIHFVFERTPSGGIAVRDLGSTLGTQANGEFLGAEAPRDRLGLALGENTVLAGGGDSPFAFRVVVAEEA